MTPIRIPRDVLGIAEATFLANGTRGLETTGMLRANSSGIVTGIVIPDQVANPFPLCWVEVTRRGKFELAAALEQGETYVARIHSHPGAAFHSETDDRNPALTYEGALSIVVPNFGAGLASGLEESAIYRRSSRSWVELPPGPDRDAYVRADD
ncbi:MAG: Mov34/MPN/PAD-1 family protein [bacterium]|nr:Mov34/MPN/PAD-1 family protein [bacterium]